MKNAGITFQRAAIAGIWGSFLFYVGREVMAQDGLSLLFGVPLLGSPWRMFMLNDKAREDKKTTSGEAIATILIGAFISMFCIVPFVLLYSLAARLF